MSQTMPSTRRNQGKPGELELCSGLGLLFIAPLVLAIVHNEDAESEVLRTQGVVAEARITGHDDRIENYTGRRGRPKTRHHYFLDLDYDANAVTPYGQWRAQGVLAPSPYPATVSQEIEVGSGYLETYPVGATAPVVFLRGDSASVELVEEMEYESSWSYFFWHYLAMAAVFVLGLFLTRMGWRKRTARG